MADYNKVGLLVLRGDRILFCRKNNTTSKLILPGGCIEEGESALQCLQREVQEELGDVRATNIKYLGAYEELAANDDPSIQKNLRIELYQGELDNKPVPSSEITELVWFDPASDRSQLTPITINKILPDLIARRILPWNS